MSDYSQPATAVCVQPDNERHRAGVRVDAAAAVCRGKILLSDLKASLQNATIRRQLDLIKFPLLIPVASVSDLPQNAEVLLHYDLCLPQEKRSGQTKRCNTPRATNLLAVFECREEQAVQKAVVCSQPVTYDNSPPNIGLVLDRARCRSSTVLHILRLGPNYQLLHVAKRPVSSLGLV